MVAPVPMAATGPAMVNPGVSSRPPGFVPALPYPGAGAVASNPSLPVASAPGFIGSNHSLLQGYQPNAPIVSVPAGTPLSDGNLFASHIYGLLQRFGASMTPSQLLDLAARLFTDVAGLLPTSPEVAILEQIVKTFIDARASGGITPGTTINPGPTPTGSGSSITITITIQAPENVDVKVDRKPAQTTPVQNKPDQNKPDQNKPGQTGTSPPPTAPLPEANPKPST